MPAPSVCLSIGSAPNAIATSPCCWRRTGQSPQRVWTSCLALARDWTPPRFPLAGRDVVALGIPPGERVGRLVDAVRDWWEAGDFTADRTACLAYLQALVNSSPQHPQS